MSYAWQQLRKAVNLLVSADTPRQRLRNARIYLLSLKQKDLPKEAYAYFDYVMQKITLAEENQGEDDALNLMTDAEVAFTISFIIEMFDKVARYQPCPIIHRLTK